MAVTSKNLDANGRVIEEEDDEPPRPRGSLAAALALFMFGALGWAAGGKYTTEGWIIWLNLFLGWLGIPARVPTLQGAGFILAALLAYVYSEVEVRHRPVRRVGKSRQVSPLPIIVLWLLIVGTDAGSTFQGVSSPARDAWTLTKEVAGQPLLAGTWSLILTFGPEWLILAGIRVLRGK